ncbi:ATP-binding protein, partial [Vibrio anguillarum]|nr:ATP-binding protein [Vibrio anguillarum]
LAQARSILLADSAEDEMLSVELFDTVFEDEFSIVRPMLDALRRGNKKKVEECNDLVFPKLEESIIGAFDRLVSQPLPKPKPVELGDSTENNVVNSAISAIVSMGIAEDIAR